MYLSRKLDYYPFSESICDPDSDKIDINLNSSNLPKPTPSKTLPSTLAGLSSRFSLDLTPRLIFSHSKFVELALQSKIARYLEFKAPQAPPRMLVPLVTGSSFGSLDTFQSFTVPTSKSAVFQDKTLTLGEKRSLMRFMTGVVEKLEIQGCEIL